MATKFTMADGDVVELLNKVVQRWHPDLTDFKVKIGVLLAWNPDGPAVKHGGYPAFATVKPVPLKDRLTKGYDVEMLIDGKDWEQMRPRHRAALLDHECSHLVVARDSNYPTQPKLDDLGRPIVKTKNGDWNVGDGFRAVVARHGRFAIEKLSVAKAVAFCDGGEMDHLKDMSAAHSGDEAAARRIASVLEDNVDD